MIQQLLINDWFSDQIKDFEVGFNNVIHRLIQ